MFSEVLITAAIVDFDVLGLSGLTKKSVYADKILATLLGVKEGEHVSYSQLSTGLHRYIKDNRLKNAKPENLVAVASPIATPILSEPRSTVLTATVTKMCRDCGAEIPAEAVFCDLCGVRQ